MGAKLNAHQQERDYTNHKLWHFHTAVKMKYINIDVSQRPNAGGKQLVTKQDLWCDDPEF